jgi:hypothetical protein
MPAIRLVALLLLVFALNEITGVIWLSPILYPDDVPIGDMYGYA